MMLKQQQDGWHVAGNMLLATLGRPRRKKSTERKDPLVSLVLSLDLARKTGLSGSCVVGFPFWGRR